VADIFKQQVVRFTVDGRRCPAGTPGAVRTVTMSKKWYATVAGKRVPLSADKRVAQQMLRKLLGDAEMKSVGLVDPLAGQKVKPLTVHLADYAHQLTAKGDTPAHVQRTVARVTALLEGCGAVVLADLDASRVAAWLASRREDVHPVNIPPGNSFDTAQVAVVLGLTPRAVRAAMQRHGLKMTGEGATRRIPRETVVQLATRQARGWSPATMNQYIKAARGFTSWLVLSRRVTADPLDTLSLANTAIDVRRGRRELSPDEFQRLLTATLASTRSFRGLDGEARHALYATATGTGFRANALANLTPADFDLTPGGPTVTLPARFNKAKKRKVQPLPADVAELLRGFLAGRVTDRPVWPGTWAGRGRAAMMIRVDLEAAGIPYAVPGPDGMRYADFHAVGRHTFITALGKNGVDLRTAQLLAGHSSPDLTAKYSHRNMCDLTAAVAQLPSLTAAGSGYTRVTRPTATTGHQPAPSDTSQMCTHNGGPVQIPLEIKALDTARPSVTPSGTLSPAASVTDSGGTICTTFPRRPPCTAAPSWPPRRPPRPWRPRLTSRSVSGSSASATAGRPCWPTPSSCPG
jgi:integrase/recombinase XerC